MDDRNRIHPMDVPSFPIESAPDYTSQFARH
jgi:hypothetical protein